VHDNNDKIHTNSEDTSAEGPTHASQEGISPSVSELSFNSSLLANSGHSDSLSHDQEEEEERSQASSGSTTESRATRAQTKKNKEAALVTSDEIVESFVLSASDLSGLLPICPTSIYNFIGADSTLPAPIKLAVQKCVPNSRTQSSGTTTRERFILAVHAALQIVDVSSDQRRHSIEKLIATGSEAQIALGSGVDTVYMKEVSRVLKYTPGATSAKSLERIDAASRVLLEAVEGSTTIRAIIILKQIEERAKKATPASFNPTPAIGAAAVRLGNINTGKVAPIVKQVHIIPISGDSCRCWYAATSHLLQVPAEEIDSTVEKTLDSINDAKTLANYGLPIAYDKVASAEEIKAAKKHYLDDRERWNKAWGGTVEMNLYSHSVQGKLSFFTIDYARDKYERQCSVPLGDPKNTTEVYLHHCHMHGKGAERPPNHYQAIEFELMDGRRIKKWEWVKEETSAARLRRMRLIRGAAAAADVKAARKYKEEMAEAEAAARQFAEWNKDIEEQEAAGRKTPVNNTRKKKPTASSRAASARANTSDNIKEQHKNSPAKPVYFPDSVTGKKGYAAAAATPAPPTPPRASTTRKQVVQPVAWKPPAVKASMWREIPSSCRQSFLDVTLPMFAKYAKLDGTDQVEARAKMVHIILDLPAQALIKGSGSRNKDTNRADGPIQKLNQTLRSLTKICNEYQHLGLHNEKEPEEDTSHMTTREPPVNTTQTSATSTPTNNEHRTTDALTHAVRRATSIVSDGGPHCLSRACNALLQQPLAPVDEKSISALQALHPKATESMTQIPANKALDIVAVNKVNLLSILKKRVNNGSAPGPSGWSGSHLQLIADSGNEEAINGLCMLTRDICNGIFGGATQQRLLAALLIPISKGEGRGVRPIAMGEVFYKLAAHYSMSLIEKHLPALFPKIQFGVKRSGGSESAAQLTRALLAQSSVLHPSTIALKTDFQNAFNACSRAAIWSTLTKHSCTEPMWKMFHWSYAQPSPLLLYDHQQNLSTVIPSSQGMRQGDPFSGFGFALGVQPMYEACIKDTPACEAVSVQDDLTLTGPQEQVFKAYDIIKNLSTSYHLTLRVDKCAVYIPATVPKAIQTTITNECSKRNLNTVTNLETLGVLIGTDEHVVHHAESIATSHEQLFQALEHPNMPTQIAMQLLRYCMLPRLGFLARTIPPKQFQSAAKLFDARIKKCFLTIMKLPDKPSLPGMSEESMYDQIKLQISCGGFGLRPLTMVSPAAYYASAAAIIPDFIKVFPGNKCRDYTQTQLYTDIEHCQQQLEELLQQQKRQLPPPVVKSPRSKGIRRSPSNPAQPPAIPTREQIKAALFEDDTNNKSVPAASDNNTIIAERVLYTASELWSKAKEYMDTTTPTDPFMQPEELQRQACHQIEAATYTRMHHQSSSYRKALLTSLVAPGSSHWLSTIPTQPTYRMKDESVRLACRHRLGLLPFDQLINRNCSCIKHDSFNDDPDHFHSCVKYKRTALTYRHDNIVQVVCDLARLAGFSATREPNGHIRPENIANSNPCSEEYNQHADILLVKYDMKLYLDVSIARPTTASQLKDGSKTLHTPLQSSRIRSCHKHGKYDDIAEINDYEMIPFVLETYGGIGAEAVRLLKRLSKSSKEYTAQQFMTHAYNRLSVTLQSSNANVQLECMQQHILREQQANPHSFDHWIRKKVERTGRYAEPKDSNKLAKDIERAMNVADAEISPTPTTTRTPSPQPVSSSSSSSSQPLSSQSEPPFIHANTSGRAGVLYMTIDEDDQSVDTDLPNQMHAHRHVVASIDHDQVD
jgi:hypothetical protein